MRSILNFILLAFGSALLFASCNKVDDLKVYDNGKAPVLTASTIIIAPLAADSNSTVLSLSWTKANHATSSDNVKYTIEIDSAGKNFSRPFTRVVTNTLSTTFTAKELNNILLGYGYAFNVPVDMEVRVTSSYANNNERLTSNIMRIRMTPYKIPLK